MYILKQILSMCATIALLTIDLVLVVIIEIIKLIVSVAELGRSLIKGKLDNIGTSTDDGEECDDIPDV